MTMIRKNSRSQNGWNNADIDTLFCLFNGGKVWDGDLPSKEARSHLVEHGYAARGDGHNWLTDKGRAAFLASPVIAESAAKRRETWGHSPFVRNEHHVN